MPPRPKRNQEAPDEEETLIKVTAMLHQHVKGKDALLRVLKVSEKRMKMIAYDQAPSVAFNQPTLSNSIYRMCSEL
jgi:hypothetical protein